MASDEQELEILAKLADIAALAGIKGSIDKDVKIFTAGFNLAEGRSQLVFARALPEAVDGKDAVYIYSACRRVKTGFMQGLKKNEAFELLKLNTQVLIARYGIDEIPGGYMIEASADCILDTLDPEELEAYFSFVAIAADTYEKKFGGDEF